MTTLDTVLRLVLSNALAAAALAVGVAILTRRLRWPAAAHLLWLAVLLRMVAPPLFQIPLLPAPAAPTEGLVAVSGSLLGLAAEPTPRTLDMRLLLLTAWAAGASIVLALAVIRTRQLRRLLGRPAAAPDPLVERVAALARRLGVRPPRTLVVEGRLPPMLWGTTTRPTLILPSELALTLDQRRLDALLAHELAHLARRDHWVRWLELAVTVFCWFNPITWWARHQLRRAEERSADEVVSRLLPDHARDYADTLVATLRFLAGIRVPATVGAVGMADLSEIQRRLEMIMTTLPRRRSPVARLVLGAAILATLAFTPLASGRAENPSNHTKISTALDQPISLNLEDADLLDVLTTFAEVTGAELKITPDVHGTVSVRVEEVPAAEVLSKILQQKGLSWVLEDNVLKVFAAERSPSPMITGQLDGKDVYRYSEDLFSEPQKISGSVPAYPEDARQDKVTGVVVMDALIDATGRVQDVTVLRSVDNRLSEAAMTAVRDWVFEPAMKDGVPVAVRYTLTMRFNLE
ncbi:MAG: TonB family protein [Deltaproteobacteria bacterium]|jgi:TonB family protein|nr:TonB family protein [Deltaproteobacteria bacterium]MBW2534933.1 TonB family protein [Deltaproteobacteria bacterium]